MADAFEQAQQLHAAGRFVEAAALYRDALAQNPQSIDALGNLGLVLQQLNDLPAAEEVFRKITELSPRDVRGHNQLGIVLGMQRRFDEAASAFRVAIAIDPAYAEAYANLGNAFGELGRLAEAEAACRRAIQLAPQRAAAWNNLVTPLYAQGRFAEAADAAWQAMKLAPQHVEAHFNYAQACGELGRRDDAIAALRRVVQLRPHYPQAHLVLAQRLRENGQLTASLEAAKRALADEPDSPQARLAVALAYQGQGRIDEAMGQYKLLRELHPDFDHRNVLLALHYISNVDRQMLFDEHRRWGARFDHVERFAHRNSREPDRKLRIGYVSSDFFEHPVAFFIEPILASHDRGQFEIFCYSGVMKQDAVTARLKRYADNWRDARMSDEHLAETANADRIDILIDLAGHTVGNRLPAFARKPAPVQVTYLGYANTTGLTAMDYWLSDAILDLPGESDAFATEQIVRLPRTFACYAPPKNAPAVAKVPSVSRGYIAFASFNNLAKIGEKVIELWAKIMRELPRSRLLLMAQPLRDGDVRELVQQRFAHRGIDVKRLTLLSGMPLVDYLRLHDQVDIMLDPFPFTGHTVSLHGLWMGVPLVTLAGDRHIARRGVDVLTNLGLPELIARNEDEYAKIAIDLANDSTRLAELRGTLRERLRTSPLCDAIGVTREIETAFRRMWKRWCDNAS